MYFERQVGGNCRIHAVNSLLGEPAVSSTQTFNRHAEEFGELIEHYVSDHPQNNNIMDHIQHDYICSNGLMSLPISPLASITLAIVLSRSVWRMSNFCIRSSWVKFCALKLKKSARGHLRWSIVWKSSARSRSPTRTAHCSKHRSPSSMFSTTAQLRRSSNAL